MWCAGPDPIARPGDSGRDRPGRAARGGSLGGARTGAIGRPPGRGAERRRLAGDGSLAADMESWWLLAADPAPLAVVRVVCDTPAAELVSLSLPWRARRALAVISRIAATLDSRETQIAPDRWRGLERTAPGGGS